MRTQDAGSGTQDLGPWTQNFKMDNAGYGTWNPWTNSGYLIPILICFCIETTVVKDDNFTYLFISRT